MHTFMQNYFLAYDDTKDDISSHILRFILDIFSVLPFHCLKCHYEALEKTFDYIWKFSLSIIGYFSYKRDALLIHKFRFISTKKNFYPTNDQISFEIQFNIINMCSFLAQHTYNCVK